jgi:hypothetical protein
VKSELDTVVPAVAEVKIVVENLGNQSMGPLSQNFPELAC